MQKPLIAGNWKMNAGGADGLALARALLASRPEDGAVDLVVFPPALVLARIAGLLEGQGIGVGGQDCHPASSGAHTGDLSAEMLAEAGAGWVLAGHSERRQDHGEGDDLVRAKAEAAHRAGLVCVICVGETECERDRGETLDVLSRQIAGSTPPSAGPLNTVIAYEPVWAIGTGRTPGLDDVAEAHAHIRATLESRIRGGKEIRILYGGSVKPDNAAALLAVADVDGALVGGASLDAASFLAIAGACLRS